MPPSEQDPDSFEPVIVDGVPAGAPIDVITPRRFFDLGERMMTRVHKMSEDTSDYVVSLRKWLAYDEVIESVTGWADRDGITVTNVVYSDIAVQLWLASGEDEGRYIVQLEVVTSDNRRLDLKFTVTTEGDHTVVLLSSQSLTFPATQVGAVSSSKQVVLTNVGSDALTITGIAASGDFVQTNNCGSSLAAGASCTINVVFGPSTIGQRTGTLAITTLSAPVKSVLLTGPAYQSVITISISDAVLVTEDVITISISDAVLVTVSDAVGMLAVSPSSLSFGPIDVDADSSAMQITVTNTGDALVAISDVQVIGMFSATDDYDGALSQDESFTIDVVFSPTSAGAKAGSIVITSDASNDPVTVPLSGTGAVEGITALSRLHTAGNQILNEDDEPVRLKSVNWFGAEGSNYTPHGTWGRPYKTSVISGVSTLGIIDQIADMGFNCIRLPFSGDFCTEGRMPASISEYHNPDLAGLTAIEVFDKLIDYCLSKGIYVVLDHHRRTAGAGADGTPVSESYTEEDWIANWEMMAERYAEHTAVIGADLHNEPHSLDWAPWVAYAEACGDAIHAIAPEWLIFVEGVGSYDEVSYWWGGQLAGVADLAVALTLPNKLVYSPHEYGQSVAVQSWLDYDSSPAPDGWPDNLYAVWNAAWGFIFEEEIAPIWIGEFGGFFGYDGSGAETKPHSAPERQWLAELCKYLNGDFDGDDDSDLGVGDVGMSFAYWSFNPNSGDTGGLLLDDWITPQSGKLALLAPLLED